MSRHSTQLNDVTSLIKRPHVTERSTVQSMNAEHPVYTFVVADDATKPAIKSAIKTLYNVTPKKVAVVTVRPKKVFIRGRRGTQAGFKKALVYLQKGDKIDFA